MQPQENEKLLLKNCFYIWPGSDDPPLEQTDILIQGNRIKKIGKKIPNPADTPPAPCQGERDKCSEYPIRK